MSLRSSSRVIEIRVRDLTGQSIPGATVTGRRRTTGAVVPLQFDERLRAWTGDLDDSEWLLRAEAPGLQAEERLVNVSPQGVQATFILARPGLPFYYHGGTRIPFDLPELVAVALKPGMEPRSGELQKLADQFGAVPVETRGRRERAAVGAGSPRVHQELLQHPPRGARVDAVAPALPAQPQRVWTYGVQAGPARSAQFEAQVRALPFVRHSGKVLHQTGTSTSFMTDELVVAFRDGVDVKAAASARRLNIVRQFKHQPNLFLLRGEKMSSSDLLETCNRWVDDPSVLWAEPNLANAARLHFTPDDFSGQFHHPFISSEAAWDVVRLHQRATPVIAIIDEGCDITHPDLAGNLQQVFDFSSLSSAQIFPSAHGTKAAGVAVAIMNNTTGIAGVAGMCRFMAIQMPDLQAGTDVEFADMFLWCAGIDPGNPALPAPPVPAADVLSNSWVTGEDRPLSFTIISALDTVTTNGRGGKGTIVMFASGNDGDDLMIKQPWAAHANVIAVGSSTVGLSDTPDRKAPSSNFGSQLDLCAPGGDVTGSTWSTQASTVDQTGTPGAYAVFGQTSCACPQVAGAAALMLAVNPNLTGDEVRDLLQQSADKIDAGNTDPIGAYDANGHSQFYGFGRLNACAAVKAAHALGGS